MTFGASKGAGLKRASRTFIFGCINITDTTERTEERVCGRRHIDDDDNEL